MKQSDATELLDEKLRTDFAAAWPAVPYALNNETFRPAARPFARFIVAGVTAEQKSLGAVGKRRFEYKGTFVAQLFGELDVGTRQIDLIVDSVRSIFQSKHLGAVADPLWTKAGVAANPIQKDGLHMVALSIPFSFFNLE